MRWLRLLLLVPILCFAAEGRPPPREDAHLINLGIGGCNIIKGEMTLAMLIEYRSKWAFYKNHITYLRPLLGVMATAQGASYYYAGIAFDFLFPIGIAFTPSFAPGYYAKGGGKDLGYPLEFRTAAELSYQFRNFSRIGAMFFHISNASLGSKNPGTECFIVYYSVPLNF